MSRNGWWLASVLLVLAAPGCVGTAGVVGSNEQALSLRDLAVMELGDELVAELETCDCVQAGRAATELGQQVVWGVLTPGADLAVLEIDGMLACSAPVESLDPGERSKVISLQTLWMRPDPEPADPDESRPDPEPASPDENRPDPEPATGGSSSDSDDDTSPDQNRPDPEPATGGTLVLATVTTQ